MTIITLSNRADLISGGSALVELKTPGFVFPATLKVDRDGTDITAAFAQNAQRPDPRPGHRAEERNQPISATTTDGSWVGAQLVITNHPIGGPVLLASQTTPWVCATPVPVAAVGNTPATNASGLSTTAIDAQCNIATEYKLWYRTFTPARQLLVRPARSVADDRRPEPPTPATRASSLTCRDDAGGLGRPDDDHAGVTVPYIVRVERGTLNRGIYDIAVLFDPTKPAWTATAPQPQWNGKVVYSYGASTGQPRQQFRTEQNWADDTALTRGFMVVDHSLTDSLYNSNRILAAETTMMMKEHIVDTYGEIKFTMGNGCSGGSIGQNTVSSIYPGLLDGIQPSCDFSDSITTGIEVTDCVLLINPYATAASGRR